MSLSAFRSFPSQAWHEANCETNLIRRYRWAIIGTFLRNLAMFKHGMFVIGADVDMSRKLESGEIRISYNPFRRVIDFPFVYTYLYALRRAHHETLEERVEATRKFFHSDFLSPAMVKLDQAIWSTDTPPARVLIAAGDTLYFHRLRNAETHKEAIPELAAELRACVREHEVKPDDRFRPIVEGDTIYLESLTTREEIEKKVAEENKGREKAEVIHVSLRSARE